MIIPNYAISLRAKYVGEVSLHFGHPGGVGMSKKLYKKLGLYILCNRNRPIMVGLTVHGILRRCKKYHWLPMIESIFIPFPKTGNNKATLYIF